MSQREPCDFEWARAETCLAEAQAQDPAVMPISLVGTAYYAAFHAALAVLLLKNNSSPKKHAIVVEQFGLVVKDLAPPLRQAGRDLRRLKDLRTRADYETGTTVSASEASAAREIAKAFLSLCAAEFGFPRERSFANG